MIQLKGFLISFSLTMLLIGAGCGNKKKSYVSQVSANEQQSETSAETTNPLLNKGIGPVKSVTLGDRIDEALATKGKSIYDAKCTPCHKPVKKFIGPAPKNILKRRSPEWVMNMILNPEEMVKKDPLAKELFIEYNGAPMANQNLTREEARAVLEYFRIIK